MARTTAGRDWMSDRLLGDAPHDGEAQILALSEDSNTIAAGWTELGGAPGNELASEGFSRAVADYAHTAGASTATLNHVFVHSAASGDGPARTIRKVGVFAYLNAVTPPGAADTGILVFALDEPNPPVLTGTDSLDQTVLIDFGT